MIKTVTVDIIDADAYTDAVMDGADYIAFSFSSPMQSQGGLMWDVPAGPSGRPQFPQDPGHPYHTYCAILYENREFLSGKSAEKPKKAPKVRPGARKDSLSYDDSSDTSAFSV